mgnify:CR=1 FL=1
MFQIMKELNKFHVKALEKLMAESLPEKLREFREDKERSEEHTSELQSR